MMVGGVGESTLYETTAPVGSFHAGKSYFGVLNMAGNVREWTLSSYRKYPYEPEGLAERIENERGTHRVIRGGSFNHETLTGYRLTTRSSLNPATYAQDTGFRVVYIPNQ